MSDVSTDTRKAMLDQLIGQLKTESEGIHVLHALEEHFGWEVLVATRNDADTRLQEMCEDDEATLSDEEWLAVSSRLDFANDVMMESFWTLVEYALQDALPDERTQPDG